MNVNTYIESVKGVYIGEGLLCLELFRKSNDDLLWKITSNSFAGLLLSSCIAGLETYLRDRLYQEVFFNHEQLSKYIKIYKRKNKKAATVLENELARIGNFNDYKGLPKSLKKRIETTLDEHIYHRLGLIDDSFKQVCGLSIKQCKKFKELTDIVETRNRIVHDVLTQKITISDSIHAYEITGSFIAEIESIFLSNHRKGVLSEFELRHFGVSLPDDIILGPAYQ